MLNLLKGISLIVVVLLLLLFGGAFFIVNESEQVVITQFGEPVGEPITEPGLNFKIPLIQKANYFDRRFLAWDGEPKQVSTRDKRFININTYARWRISDPLKYAQRLFDETKAQNRLGAILEGATQNEIANHDLIELVRSTNREYISSGNDNDQNKKAVIERGRDALRAAILDLAKERTSDLGIEVLDFQFKRINYVPEVRNKVYERSSTTEKYL